jgi:5-methylcytosine-specific restriction protein A
MPRSPLRPCGRCGQPVFRGGFCRKHYGQADRARGTSVKRGYNVEHRDRFRAGVLRRAMYVCVMCGDEATVADHYPRTRRELVLDGDDPNDPQYGRALCAYCHNRHTAGGSIARRG